MARQGDLFSGSEVAQPFEAPGELPLLSQQLLSWQGRLQDHQAPLFARRPSSSGEQSLLFEPDPADPTLLAASFSPLELQPQALSFWRWPQAPQQGAALYFVIDRCKLGRGCLEHGCLERDSSDQGTAPLLLYVGETAKADQRWKGDHDCKTYLAAYQEALQKAGLSCQLSIRFWLDVPLAVRPRRALEQALIRRWLPPFNKETRGRWATPFTAEPKPPP